MLRTSIRLKPVISATTLEAGKRTGIRVLATRSGPVDDGGTMIGGTRGAKSGWKSAHEGAPQGGAEPSLDVKERLTSRQRRAIYRSKQRGLLELDILLGQWAVRHVPLMTSEDELRTLEILLDQDSPHLLNWVLKKSEPPSHIDLNVVRSLQEFAVGDDHVLNRGSAK